MTFTCPVCFYDKLTEPAQNYSICPSCGTEFGNDDELHTHAELREKWIRNGAKWFFRQPPASWNPEEQLLRGGVVLPIQKDLLKARAG